MTLRFRVVAACVVVSFALAGPFAPIVLAQQPSQPVAPAPVTQAPAPPAQATPPPQSELFQETLKAQNPYPQPPMGQELLPENRTLSRDFYEVAAGVATAFVIPGHAIICTLGGVTAVGVLLLTFGSGYRPATRVLEEGCGGKWIITADDLAPTAAPYDMIAPPTQ